MHDATIKKTLTWKFIVTYLYVSSHQDITQVHAILKGMSVTEHGRWKGEKLQIRSAFFCVITQRKVAIHYQRFA